MSRYKVLGFSFQSSLFYPAQMHALLNANTEIDWRERFNDYHGEYLMGLARYGRHGRARIRIYKIEGRFLLDVIFWPETEDLSYWEKLLAFVKEKILPLIRAESVEEADSFD